MAQRHVVQLVDDLDGSEAVKTVDFVVNDNHYEVDLSETNLVAFERTISRYLKVARSDDATAQRRWASIATQPGPAAPPEPEPVFDGSAQDMRLWAQRKHMVVRPRARIPREIEHAYLAVAQRVRGTVPAG